MASPLLIVHIKQDLIKKKETIWNKKHDLPHILAFLEKRERLLSKNQISSETLQNHQEKYSL